MSLATTGRANYLELYEGDLNDPPLQAAIAAARQQLQ